MARPTDSTIMIVDDNDLDRGRIRRTLQRQQVGCSIVEAANGMDALAELRTRMGASQAPPDVILLDLDMPRMDGRQFLRALRSDERIAKTVVIALSAAKDRGQIGAMYDLNVAAYIVKSEEDPDFLEVAALLESLLRTATFADPQRSTPHFSPLTPNPRLTPSRQLRHTVEIPRLLACLSGEILLAGLGSNSCVELRRALPQVAPRTTIREVETLAEAPAAIGERQPVAVFARPGPAAPARLSAVEPLLEVASRTAVIVEVDYDDRSWIVELEALGAQDHLRPGASPEIVGRVLHNALVRHSLKMQLDRTRHLLARAENEVEDLAAVFAHDLRGPLVAASRLGQVLAARDVGEKILEAMGEQLDEKLHTVTHLVASMLAYADLRHEDGDMAAVDLSRVVRTVAGRRSQQIEESGADLSVTGIPVVVRGSHEHLVDLVDELVKNAIDFRRLDRKLRLSIDVAACGDVAKIAVADNGTGIPDAQFERAVRLMERLHDDRGTGLGLGLPRACRIAANHGGILRLGPSDAGGTLALLELPIRLQD